MASTVWGDKINSNSKIYHHIDASKKRYFLKLVLLVAMWDTIQFTWWANAPMAKLNLIPVVLEYTGICFFIHFFPNNLQTENWIPDDLRVSMKKDGIAGLSRLDINKGWIILLFQFDCFQTCPFLLDLCTLFGQMKRTKLMIWFHMSKDQNICSLLLTFHWPLSRISSSWTCIKCATNTSQLSSYGSMEPLYAPSQR